MTRNLSINTATNDRNAGKKWTPSPEMAIREEEQDGEFSSPISSKKDNKLSQQRLIEEEDEEEEEPEEEDEEEDEEGEEEEDNDSDYTSSPSIPDENINFDLVYTLHTFEATVDGQASVKKGDALTLLDDSNSYWWLIRDLKTSEVGYIPAENIETPFERLARLNKHRNVELTSIEQAAHYINKEPQPPKHNKKVVLSTSLNVQLHVILVGDDEDEEPEVTYEEWDEEMLDDDEDDQEAQQQTTPIKDDDHTPLVMPDAKNNNLPSSEIHQQNKSPTAINTNDAAANNNATGNNNNHAPATDPVTRQIPRVVEEEDEEDKPSTTTTTPAAKQKVLRIFAGNVDVGASYHSVRVTESTSVDELLASAMEKFHISQIETKHHGRSTTNFKNSCVEYFLTVKTRDGDEITLDPKDKPFAIHESLTAHLTTPMPSLTHFRQLASSTDHIRVNSASANKSSNKKKKRSSFVGNSSIQFFMHKRIKRVNAQSGKVHIKVSLMTTSAGTPVTEKLNAIQKITTLGRFGVIKKKKKDAGPSAGSASGKEERIDKLIAIPANISISDLTSTALVKFHIITDENQPHHYRLILSANGKDTLLNSNQILSDVIKDLGEETTNERYFVLHNFNSHLEDKQKQTKLAPPHQRSLSLSSSTSSSSTTSSSANNNNNNGRHPTTSKVFPEINLGGDSTTFYSHHPVMTRLDSNTEVILKRIDAALEAYEKANNHRNNSVNVKKNNSNNSNFPSPMSVSRNESGVDIHLPHGLLRSTALSEKKTQYSLMTTPNTLVLQKVLPADNSTSKPTATAANTAAAANLKNVVSGEEMATLIKYGSQYLDTYDTANKPFSASNRLFMDGDGEKSLSSLDDLEKELQRIIKSHSS